MNNSQIVQAMLSHQYLSVMDLKALDIDLSTLSLKVVLKERMIHNEKRR